MTTVQVRQLAREERNPNTHQVLINGRVTGIAFNASSAPTALEVLTEVLNELSIIDAIEVVG